MSLSPSSFVCASWGIALPSHAITTTQTPCPITRIDLRAFCYWIASSVPDETIPSGCPFLKTPSRDNTLWDREKRFSEDSQTRPTHRCNISIRHSQTLHHSSTQTLDISQKPATSAVLILSCLLAQNGIVLTTWFGIWNSFLLAFCFQTLPLLELMQGFSK